MFVEQPLASHGSTNNSVLNILGQKDEWINQLINHEAVYRTAPATPGLLMTEVIVEQPRLHRVC